jgi:DNA repair exonuclease SbcCD ATPase subunit
MKPLNSISLFMFCSVILLINAFIYAEQTKQVFIREYEYKASEFDSMHSSRTNALQEVKRILLEEIGIYIESWVVSGIKEESFQVNEFFRQEVKTITAGITETQITDERWDGYNYYVKASITVDTNDVLRRINQAIEAKINSEEVKRLETLLVAIQSEKTTLSREVTNLQSRLQAEQRAKESVNAQLNQLKKELGALQEEQRRINAETARIQSTADQIRQEIRRVSNRVLSVSKLMNQNEVVRVAGNPRIKKWNDHWNYGEYWVIFNSGLVRYLLSHAVYDNDPHGTRGTWVRNNLLR